MCLVGEKEREVASTDKVHYVALCACSEGEKSVIIDKMYTISQSIITLFSPSKQAQRAT
jgi:hypothetical protein